MFRVRPILNRAICFCSPHQPLSSLFFYLKLSQYFLRDNLANTFMMWGRISSQLQSDRLSFRCAAWRLLEWSSMLWFTEKICLYPKELCVRLLPSVSPSSYFPPLYSYTSTVFFPLLLLLYSGLRNCFKWDGYIAQQWFNKHPVHDSFSIPWTNEGFSTFQSNPQGDLCSQSSEDQQMVSWQLEREVKGAHK